MSLTGAGGRPYPWTGTRRASLGAQASSGAWRSFASLWRWPNPWDGSWAKSPPSLLARRCKAGFWEARTGRQKPPEDRQSLLRYIRPRQVLPQEEASLWMHPTKTSGSNLPGPEALSAGAELRTILPRPDPATRCLSQLYGKLGLACYYR